jgi:predicted anti-sigma-YlaC factor YlaD
MTKKTCRFERARFLQRWEQSGILPDVREYPHLQGCATCAHWQQSAVAALAGIGVRTSPSEQARLLTEVRRRIRLEPRTLRPQSAWQDWTFPVALSSVLFGYAAALFVRSYFGWLTDVSSLFISSTGTDFRVASGVAITFVASFAAAIWVTYALVVRRLPNGALQTRSNGI